MSDGCTSVDVRGQLRGDDAPFSILFEKGLLCIREQRGFLVQERQWIIPYHPPGSQ